MIELKYTFNINKGLSELDELFDFLHRYYEYIPANYNDIKSLSDSNRQKTDRINELEKQLEYLKQEKLNLSNRETEYKKKIDEHDENVERINKEHETEVCSLKNQIEELKKKISRYEPILNGEIDSEKYFKITNDTLLEETMDNEAPFVGKIDAEGNAIFNFNVDKGKHNYYSQNHYLLQNFCEITKISDGVINKINPGECGKGHYNNGVLFVRSKAKISITRNKKLE